MASTKMVEQLLDTLVELFNDPDVHTLSVDDIVEKHWEKDPGESARKEVAGRLAEIREKFYTRTKKPTCLVAETFWSEFYGVVPTEIADLKKCLPGGYDKSACGLSRHPDLLRTAISRDGKSGAGKTRVSLDRLIGMFEQGNISEEQILETLESTVAALKPEQRQVMGRLFGKLIDDGDVRALKLREMSRILEEPKVVEEAKPEA